jgi:hypothetical protein
MFARLACGAIAIVMLASVVRMIMLGRTSSYYGEQFVARRSKEPLSFWTLIVFYFSLGVFLGWLAVVSRNG